MLRDIVRACLVIAVMAVAAALLVETRYQLAAIDVAHRQTLGQPAPLVATQQAQPQPPSPLRRLGRAGIDLADATLGIFR